jgi:hypothetical protein
MLTLSYVFQARTAFPDPVVSPQDSLLLKETEQ